MKIYHYTSLETLALILKHKTMRFNRLDRMKDPDEKSFLFHGLDWSPYTYVSCWTETAKDNLPLWHFYGQEKGVRIAMEMDFIDWDKQTQSFSVPAREFITDNATDTPRNVLSVTLNPIRIHRPLCNETVFRKVRYLECDDYQGYLNDLAIDPRLNELDEETFRNYVGVIKKERWDFQDESRFVIYAVPFTSTDAVMSHKEFLKLIRLRMPNQVPYIDVPIKPDRLIRIDVTLGPDATEAEYIIAQALLNKYAPLGKLSLSSLSDNETRFLI